MKKTSQQRQIDRADRQAEAINACRAAIGDAYECCNQFRARLDEAESAINTVINGTVMEIDARDALDKLGRRIRRIQELRRMMEVGSLVIETSRAMQQSWERLP